MADPRDNGKEEDESTEVSVHSFRHRNDHFELAKCRATKGTQQHFIRYFRVLIKLFS
jgi:hypothetical protein